MERWPSMVEGARLLSEYVMERWPSMVEGARLLSEYTGKPVSRVRIPLSP